MTVYDVAEEKIRRLVVKFRVLRDWTVEYDQTCEYKCQCLINGETKRAVIYGWSPNSPYPADYLFHEILHVAFRAARALGHEGEELFVRDVCALLYPSTTATENRKESSEEILQWLV